MRGFVAGSPLIGRYPVAIHSAETDPPHHLPVSVIIPVYADFAATMACLESVLAQGVLPSWSQVVVVDDATPEPKIARMLDVLADRGLITLIRNQRNLGFVGSINRALQSIPNGDVILLNADTIVPPNFAERLFSAAHSAADIATVTPLSNNGELTSFPRAFEANPIPDQATIFELDQSPRKLMPEKSSLSQTALDSVSISVVTAWPASGFFRKQSVGDIWRMLNCASAPDAMACAMFVQHPLTWVTPAASRFGKKNAPSLSAISSC